MNRVVYAFGERLAESHFTEATPTVLSRENVAMLQAADAIVNAHLVKNGACACVLRDCVFLCICVCRDCVSVYVCGWVGGCVGGWVCGWECVSGCWRVGVGVCLLVCVCEKESEGGSGWRGCEGGREGLVMGVQALNSDKSSPIDGPQGAWRLTVLPLLLLLLRRRRLLLLLLLLRVCSVVHLCNVRRGMSG